MNDIPYYNVILKNRILKNRIYMFKEYKNEKISHITIKLD